MKNTKFNAIKIKKICENKLGISFDGAKELNGWYKLNNKKIARITIPKGRKPIKKGTYGSMAKQLMLNIPQFDELLECPLNKSMYDEIITDGE